MTNPCVARWFRRVRTRGLFTCLLGAPLAVAVCWPAAAHTADEVQALVERAAGHIKSVGQDQAFADITRPDGGFVEGDLYVFCNSADGTVLANGGNPKLIGKSLAALRDAEGKRPVFDGIRLALTQGHGWLDYLWPNAQTSHVQRKMTYVLRIDDRTICGSGYYVLDPP